jgi:hypothetical protein
LERLVAIDRFFVALLLMFCRGEDREKRKSDVTEEILPAVKSDLGRSPVGRQRGKIEASIR